MAIENRRRDLLETLERFSIPYKSVELLNTDDDLNDVNDNQPIITNGSIYLTKEAVKRGWQPILFNDNFNFMVWYEHFKDELLNGDAVFTTIGEAEPDLDAMFIRPILDDKGFAGHVKTRSEFHAWKERILSGESRIPPDTRILYSRPRRIGQEHRHFIVSGEVISSSRYKLNGAVNYSSNVDRHIVDYAQSMADIWQPSKGFVLDTFITDDQIGIVEMGCICHAGLYQADVQRIVVALDDLRDDNYHLRARRRTILR